MGPALFCSVNKRISRIKVEKVLKPPQKPTITKVLITGLKIIFSSIKAMVKPTITQLIKLAEKVEKGKRADMPDMVLLNPKRAILPNPPPINTAINSFMSQKYRIPVIFALYLTNIV